MRLEDVLSANDNRLNFSALLTFPPHTPHVTHFPPRKNVVLPSQKKKGTKSGDVTGSEEKNPDEDEKKMSSS